MKVFNEKSSHSFHIPVLGTGFSLDTPLHVARYGISSVISLADDVLIEDLRKYHCNKNGLSYKEISDRDEDPRAKRVTAYLNMLEYLVAKQLQELKASEFCEGSEITRYFDLLPDNSPLKKEYQQMMSVEDPIEKTERQEILRQKPVAGSIDVNIMTKLNRAIYKDGEALPIEFNDALSALRGFALSDGYSSIVFSAGMNRHLYSYAADFDSFYPDSSGRLKKKIILKVSDYRSAMIQGRFLAKKGLWVSEYRIESGLNCGGHAFATEGVLMGTILEEFKNNKEEFVAMLRKAYISALEKNKKTVPSTPPEVQITMQGGIGTAEENEFLHQYYKVDGTGWGTPFLLVPEVTNVDETHLKKLQVATTNDVHLSDRSPLGVPFWSLRTSESEAMRKKRIEKKKPGSPCPKGFLVSNSEFTKVPICTASRIFQKKKLRQLHELETSDEQRMAKVTQVVHKACICNDLGGGAQLKLGLRKDVTPSVCCGPNIVNFSKVATLDEMVGHIYGRLSLLTNPERSHMFINELAIYVDYFKEEIQKASEQFIDHSVKCFDEFKKNLHDGIEYYRTLAEQFSSEQQEKFVSELDKLCEEINNIFPGVSGKLSLGTTS